MSLNYYIIIGYDLSCYRDELYTKEFKDDKNNIEKWEIRKFRGQIQLFSDPMYESYLYFGYIVSDGNGYGGCERTYTDIPEIQDKEKFVKEELLKAFPDIHHIPNISVITFEEEV